MIAHHLDGANLGGVVLEPPPSINGDNGVADPRAPPLVNGDNGAADAGIPPSKNGDNGEANACAPPSINADNGEANLGTGSPGCIIPASCLTCEGNQLF